MKLGEIMRADGKRLKHVDPMYTIAPHIMDKRYDAMNMITIDIPYEPVQNYLNAKLLAFIDFICNLWGINGC